MPKNRKKGLRTMSKLFMYGTSLEVIIIKLTIKEASEYLGVAKSTLRRWEDEGKIKLERTVGGHRRYDKSILMSLKNKKENKKLIIGYCRVSSSDQKEDLERQIKTVSDYCSARGYQFKIIKDIGSGLNYNKKGLKELIKLICEREIDRIVINYKDRLIRFRYDIIEQMCDFNGVKIEIINYTEDKTYEDELILDGQSKICNWLYNHLLEMTIKDYKENKRKKVIGKLKENLNLRNTDKIKNFRLCKQQGNKLYAIFCIERKDIDKKEINKWIAIDQNHKNFFVAIDNTGISYEFEKLSQIKYWDKVIDEIKSKRDLCSRKSKLIETETGKTYYLPSKRWTKLNNALDNAYHKRREQIKSSCYSIANWIAKNYDYVAIGDYTPTLDTATYDNMHRSMLNQEIIGEFRKILKWVIERSGKHYSKVDEKDTTKTCCICGNKEKKDPQIREFTCQKCKTKLSRDINSSVNIAKKDKLLSGSDYVDWVLSNSTYTAKWNFKKSKILFTGHTLEKSNIWMN